MESFEEILDDMWDMLSCGADEFDHPFHFPALGTTGTEGCSLRTVILRQAIPAEGILVCHTDARAPKVAEIRQHPRVSWLFYHPKARIQLRIAGSVTLHHDDDIAEQQWEASRITSRLNYCAGNAPGTPRDEPSSGLSAALLSGALTAAKTSFGRKNFMAIACKIDTIDWLRLSALGHRRARFVWHDGELTCTWLTP